MIIGIDVSSVSYQTGVSNYTLNLIRSLLKVDNTNSYKLFYSSLRLPLPKEIKDLEKHSNVKIYQFRIPLTLLQILWNKLRFPFLEFFIGKCDLFHSSDWTQPPTLKTKVITTVHDLTPFLFPQWHHKKVIKAHKNKMYWAAKKCVHFICVSKNTRKDLLDIFPKINPDKITVVYEAAENKFNSFLKLSQEKQQKLVEKIQNQYGLKNFILAQGTREPRKNLKKLIDAFISYKENNPKNKTELAITGKYGWGQDIKNSHPHIKILGFIPEKDMVALHASALCLIYPSLYEGFGLPLIKSFKVGVPVVTSDNSSLSEIADDAALLIDPKSTKDITKAIEKIIKYPRLRKKLAQKGIQHSKKFTWIKTAKQTLKIYQENL